MDLCFSTLKVILKQIRCHKYQVTCDAYSTVVHGVRTPFRDVTLLKMVQLFHELLAEGDSEHREREHIGSCMEKKHHTFILLALPKQTQMT